MVYGPLTKMESLLFDAVSERMFNKIMFGDPQRGEQTAFHAFVDAFMQGLPGAKTPREGGLFGIDMGAGDDMTAVVPIIVDEFHQNKPFTVASFLKNTIAVLPAIKQPKGPQRNRRSDRWTR